MTSTAWKTRVQYTLGIMLYHQNLVYNYELITETCKVYGGSTRLQHEWGPVIRQTFG